MNRAEEIKKEKGALELRAVSKQALASDPRPQYQDDAERLYGLTFAGCEVKFRVSGSRLEVVSVVRAD